MLKSIKLLLINLIFINLFFKISFLFSDEIKFSDLIKKNDIFFYKDSTIPFDGIVTGKETGKIINGKKKWLMEVLHIRRFFEL